MCIVLHCTRERNLIHVVIVGNVVELFTDFITNIHIPQFKHIGIHSFCIYCFAIFDFYILMYTLYKFICNLIIYLGDSEKNFSLHASCYYILEKSHIKVTNVKGYSLIMVIGAII